ncbi:MAG: PEP-CTERM sorting domain-containing protein [Phycisphaerae bacterium]|nr:PEP-CTERM sorting domain-containing protein [Phycisphaerae bacterium]
MKTCKAVLAPALFWTVAALVPAGATSAALSIYAIQYTTDPDGHSGQVGNTVDCDGGIVTHKFRGTRPKLTLQDPNFPDGWGGIQVKDWTAGLTLFDHVSVGDWVSFTSVLVEEYRGNTLLKYPSDTGSGFAVESSGNPLPDPKVVSPADIAAPVEGPVGEWYVADHTAERYEAMRLTVEDVIVTDMKLGKANDNYVLQGAGGSCWAGDYMNVDVGVDYYHPYISTGAEFQSVSGILEQYTKLTSWWDYYQLLTTETSDLVIPEPGAGAIFLMAAWAVLLRRRRRRWIAAGARGTPAAPRWLPESRGYLPQIA